MFTGVINVEKAIVHIIEKKDKVTSVKLSDYTLTLDDKLKKLIEKHISDTLINKNRNFGEFIISDVDDTVLKSCINIFNKYDDPEDIDFINESKKIARLLKNQIEKTNAKSTNLLIIEYKQGNGKAIGIIKLNFSNNFIPKEEVLDGKTKITIEINSVGFSETQKLEKAALIELENNINIPIDIFDKTIDEVKIKEYLGLITLDRQSADASIYWKDFLDCTIDDDGKNSTKKMIAFLSNMINEKFDKKPKEILEKRSILVQELNKLKEFDLDVIIQKVFDDDGKTEINNEINNKNLQVVFNVNKPVVETRFDNDTWYIDDIIIKGASQKLKRTFEIVKTYDDGKMDIMLKGVSKK